MPKRCERKLGLDRPVYVQYVEWIGGVLQGDLGTSLRNKTPVSEELLGANAGDG